MYVYTYIYIDLSWYTCHNLGLIHVGTLINMYGAYQHTVCYVKLYIKYYIIIASIWKHLVCFVLNRLRGFNSGGGNHIDVSRLDSGGNAYNGDGC